MTLYDQMYGQIRATNEVIAAQKDLLDLVREAWDRFTDGDMVPPNHKLSIWLKKAEAAILKAEKGE